MPQMGELSDGATAILSRRHELHVDTEAARVFVRRPPPLSQARMH